MHNIIIYHNPRCSKSCKTLQLLQEQNIDLEIILYLDNPPNAKHLQALLIKLGCSASDLLRKNEPEYKDLDLQSQNYSEDELINIMVKHPRLIERPIVEYGDKALIGRPPEKVLNIV